jgi:hypothetical protein
MEPILQKRTWKHQFIRLPLDGRDLRAELTFLEDKMTFSIVTMEDVDFTEWRLTTSREDL